MPELKITWEGGNRVTVTRRSEITGNMNTMEIPMHPQAFTNACTDWEKGKLIQDAFPSLSDEEREFIKSGITPHEWQEHIDPIECKTCGRRVSEDYTVGCPGCLDHEHEEEE